MNVLGQKKIFAVLFKDLRLENGLTQEDIAEKLNVSLSTVRGWEQGKRVPRPRTWGTIKSMYGGNGEIFFSLETAYLNAKREMKK